jgi:dolichol kinase
MSFAINTPALLFPAITLLMLAYTNRFLALATLIRNLHTKYKQVPEERALIHEQIKNLKRRVVLVKQMQASGIVSFFLCVLCMLFLYFSYDVLAFSIFGLSLGFLLLSLALSLNEIYISTRALEIELKDMEKLER